MQLPEHATRRATAVLIAVTAIVWIAWDCVAVAVPGATESEWFRAIAAHPLVPFALGVLMGHVFGIEYRLGEGDAVGTSIT
jgi:hypothetical protein